MTAPKWINFSGLLTIVGLASLWEALTAAHVIQFDYVPPPSKIVVGFVELCANGEMLTNVTHTVTVALSGWGLAVLVGIAAGSVLGVSARAWSYTGASLETLRSLPIVAFVPVAVLLFGFSNRAELIIAFYGAMWPILLNTYSAVGSVNRQLLEVGKVMRIAALAQVWKLRLPAAAPGIVVGLRLGLATSLVLTLVAEMIGNPQGIGFALVSKAQALEPAQMFAYIVASGIIGITLNGTLIALAKILFPGPMAASRQVD